LLLEIDLLLTNFIYIKQNSTNKIKNWKKSVKSFWAKLCRHDIVIFTTVGGKQRYISELLTDPWSKDRLNPLME